jgi:hypothetical protein
MTTALRATEAVFNAFYREQIGQHRQTAAQARECSLRSGNKRRLARALNTIDLPAERFTGQRRAGRGRSLRRLSCVFRCIWRGRKD